MAQSAEQASFDAWIKLYRPDENTNNVAISYYIKGAIVARALGLAIRRCYHDAKIAPDVISMRPAFQRFSGERGATAEEFKSTAEEVAGVPLAAFFRETVETPGELDYREALDWHGLGFINRKREDGCRVRAWAGMETRIDNGRLLVSRVPRATPALDVKP